MCPLSPCSSVCLSTMAEAALREIAPYVLAVTISDISMEERIFLNITTKEGNHFTVEQSSLGLQVMQVYLLSLDLILSGCWYVSQYKELRTQS